MKRTMAIVVCVGLTLAVAWQGQGAAPPVTRLTKEERAKLEREGVQLNQQMVKLYQEGKVRDALELARKVVAVFERLDTIMEYPDGHPHLAAGLHNLGFMLDKLGEPHLAVPYYERALIQYQKLYPERRFRYGHRNLAMSLTSVGMGLMGLGEPAKALDYYKKALAMREKLYPESLFKDGHHEIANSLNNVGFALEAMGEPAAALLYYDQALAMRWKLYPETRFKEGHPDLAGSLNNMGSVLHGLGEHSRALLYHERALAMYQRIYPKSRFPNGHHDLARSLNNLGLVLQALGEFARALPFHEQALAMRRTLYPESHFPNGHPDLAVSLNSIGHLLQALGEPAKAFPYYEEALVMRQKLYPERHFPNGHPHVANSLSNVGIVLEAIGETRRAFLYLQKAVALNQKFYPESRFKAGHLQLAISLNNLGGVLHAMGEPEKALVYCEMAVGMSQQLYPDTSFKEGHPILVRSLDNLGGVLQAMGEPAKALSYHERAHALRQKQFQRECGTAPEGQAHAFYRSLPRTRDGCLSTALLLHRSASATYGAAWPDRVALLQLMLRRAESSQVALLKSGNARQTWEEVAEIRRQISRLMFEPGRDPASRDKVLAKLEGDQEGLERKMTKLLPELEEHQQLSQLGPKDLAVKLSANTAFLDFVRYRHFTKAKYTGNRYLAFVLTPDAGVQCLQLGDAAPVDAAVASWRRSIDAKEPSNAPAQLRKLVWDKIEAALPEGTHTLYLCLDGDLTKLPFAALPGRAPDTVLLEDYALAVVPAGAWLLQQLRKPPVDDPAPRLLALGDVDFGPGAFKPLGETDRELNRVADAFPVRAVLRGNKATVPALRQHLPTARVAHLATHAYYDQKALDEEYARIRKQRETWQFTPAGTERVGLGARNPLAFAGLVLAGGNDPTKADGGGILTGLDILELPLNKMHLCVLSACETGLGEWNADAGVAGLQRAFHVAGCRNVVGSLWNVNDAATAALMAQFYHELRVNKRTPLAALREAQLTIYRHPERIADLAGERGRPALEKAAKLGSAPAKPAVAGAGKKAGTKLWAAFVLSGAGN